MNPRLTRLLGGLPGVFWTLWVGTLINRLGTFVLPFLTLFLTLERGASPSTAAGMVGLYGLGAFGASLVGGAVADRWGRRVGILVSLFGGAAVMVVVPFVEDMATLAVAVTALGFLSELYRPGVAAAVTDAVPPLDRPRAFALLYWVINLGAAIAPVLAGLLATRSYVLLFATDAATMAVYGLVVLARVPETRPEAAASDSTTVVRPGLLVAVRDPLLVGVSVGTLLVAAVFFQAYSTLPLTMTADGHGESGYGLAVGANGLVIVLLSLPIAHALAGRPKLPFLALSALVTGAGFALTEPAATLPAYAATIVVWTIGEIMLFPVAPALIGDLAPTHLRGAYQGVYHAGWGLAALAGPAVGGWIYERFGEAALWRGCLGVTVVASVLFLALVPLMRRRQASAAVEPVTIPVATTENVSVGS